MVVIAYEMVYYLITTITRILPLIVDVLTSSVWSLSRLTLTFIDRILVVLQ